MIKLRTHLQIGIAITMNCIILACGDVPEVDFSYVVDDFTGRVQFTNASTNAMDYYWSFGDKTYSYEKNPYHDFLKDKVEVTLTARNKQHKTATKTINGNFKIASSYFVFYTDSAELLPLKIYCKTNNKYLGLLNAVCMNSEAKLNNPNCLTVPVVEPKFITFEALNNSNIGIWQWQNNFSWNINIIKVH